MEGEKYSKELCGKFAQDMSEVIKKRVREELGFRSVLEEDEIK